MTAAPEAVVAPSARGHRWAMLGGVWLLYFCFGLTVAAMGPLVPAIVGELGISHGAMGSVMGAWPLVYIAAAVPCGALLDRAGPRRALALAGGIIALSGFLRGQADGHLELFLAVAVFGIGGPLVSIGAPKVISTWFEGKERGFAMGVYVSGMSLGAIAALSLSNGLMMPLLGGDWRAVLTCYAAVALIAGAVWLAIASHPASRALEREQAAKARPRQLEVFVELLRLPAVRLILAMSICIFFFNHGLNNWLPEILRSRGMSAAAAGYWAAVPTAIGILGALVIPRLATPERRLAILLALFLSAAGATLLLQLGPGLGLVSGLFLQGLARSSMMTLAILTLVEIPEVGSRHAGSAGGLFFSAAEIGGVLGPLSVGIVFDASGGFGAALVMMTGVCALLVLLLAGLRRHH